MARALCLSRASLAALERDDYARLPGGTYIRGYWKSYANLLGISIEASVAAQRLPDPQADIVAPESGHQQLSGSVEQSRRRLAVLFGLLSLLFIGSLWQWQSPPETSTPWANGNGWRGAPAQAAPPQTQPESTPPAFVSSAAWNGDLAPAAVESQLALAEPNFAEELDPSPATEPPADLATATATDNAAPPEPQPSPPSANQITLAVNHKSWVDIRDDTGERLIYRSVDPGQRLTLAGKPPFKVFIGNASGVAVEYQGKPVQLDAQSAGGFARFNLGAP